MSITTLSVEQIDTSLRLIAIGGELMILVILLIGKIRTDLKACCIGLIVGGIAYLINSSHSLQPDGYWRVAVDTAALSTTFWAWLLAQLLFDRVINYRLVYGVAAVLVAIRVSGMLIAGSGPFMFYSIHLISLALVGHLLFIAIAGRADDLVEKRRRVRTYLPLLVGLQVGGVLLAELIFGPFMDVPLLSALNAFSILILVLAAGLALLAAEPELLIMQAPTESATAPAPNMSPSETVLHEKLMAAMEEGQFRSTGLTIQTLADQLATPEHRLRLLINKRLGHRNFSSFLNGYRIAEAKQKLSDRALVDLPILTIAMDLGYGSLAPFNRAFRTESGVTPSEFRRSMIDQN